MSKVDQVDVVEINRRLLDEAKRAQSELQSRMARMLPALTYNECVQLDLEAAKLKKRIASLRGAITRSLRSRAK